MHASFSILTTAMPVGLCSYSSVAQSKDLRDIELRRLFEPTSAELRQERAGRVYLYDRLKEADIDRARRAKKTEKDRSFVGTFGSRCAFLFPRWTPSRRAPSHATRSPRRII